MLLQARILKHVHNTRFFAPAKIKKCKRFTAYKTPFFYPDAAMCKRFMVTNRNVLTAQRVLNVTSESSQEQIKLAYLKKVKETHPDQNPNSETAAEDFIKIKQAYLTLQGFETDTELKVEKSLLTQIKEAQNRHDTAFGYELLEDCRCNKTKLEATEMEALCSLLSYTVNDCLELYETSKPFTNRNEESLAWNNILRRIRNEKLETSETMNEILEILNKMDKLSIKHDLALLESQIFTFFPQH
eukprot:g3615.t1